MNEDQFRYRDDTGRAATTALQREPHVPLVICAAAAAVVCWHERPFCPRSALGGARRQPVFAAGRFHFCSRPANHAAMALEDDHTPQNSERRLERDMRAQILSSPLARYSASG
jgi:hypothetical protein